MSDLGSGHTPDEYVLQKLIKFMNISDYIRLMWDKIEVEMSDFVIRLFL